MLIEFLDFLDEMSVEILLTKLISFCRSRDVNTIDLNMGCPKHFSVHCGMGSALLKKPDTVVDVKFNFCLFFKIDCLFHFE